MKKEEPIRKVKNPDRIFSYFRPEILPLAIVTVSGIIYNVGMTAGPYFEGQLVQRLFDIMNGKKTFYDMLSLAAVYLIVILIVQGMRCIKRFYVRRFANDTSRNMRHMLYNSLVHKSKVELEEESVGTMMTKAVSDIDACVEGMRKFTTEIFDTGIVLISYLTMLLIYDWRLALISSAFTPIAYLIAEKLRKVVYLYNCAYKNSEGKLNDATLDRISNAVMYRVYGRESNRDEAYEECLADYEKKAVAANIWENTMQPIYNIISMFGVIFIIYFGAKNIMGTGWTSWNIAIFTMFLSCFAKMALKSSKAAKLFNAVQKAQVSWKRIKPLMKDYIELDTDTDIDFSKPEPLVVSHLSFTYPDSRQIIRDLSFTAAPGEIIGVTGLVASGKSTLGKVFLCESSYGGSIRIGDRELSTLTEYERSMLVTYMGHQPELMSDTIEENIRLGEIKDTVPFIKAVCFDREIAEMPDKIKTCAGSYGIRLSGGQQSRTALARTLYNGRNVLILDDPFSALDRGTERKIVENLRRMAENKIVILISHRLYMFPELEQVIWIDNKTIEVSTHDLLMSNNDVYARLYNTQVSGGDLDEE
jgi:ATP-binding cassette subfamily B multidrug efflux pump